MLDDVRPKPKNGVVVSVDVLPKVDCVFDCGPAEFSNVEVGFSEGALKANSPPDGGPKAGCVEVVEPDVDCPLPIAPKVEVVGPDAFPTDVGRVEELVDPNVDCWLPVAAVADGIEGKPKECPVPPKDPADIELAELNIPLPPLQNPDGAEAAPNLMVLGAGASDVGAAAKAATAPSVAPALFSELLVSKENL